MNVNQTFDYLYYQKGTNEQFSTMNPFEIPSSIFILLCSILGIICALIFITIVILDRQSRTMTVLFVLNSILAGLVVNIVYACQAFYQLIGDGNDELCAFRGYLLHDTCGLLYHTFCVQAFYRLLTTISIQERYLRSKRVILFVVFVQWLISFAFGLPILLTGRIKYQAGSRICQVDLIFRTREYSSFSLLLGITG